MTSMPCVDHALEQSIPASATLAATIERVCRRIPPLWDLHNYVAVNPFLGFAATPIADAARTIRDGIGAQTLPPIAYFHERWRAGAFGSGDLADAAAHNATDTTTLAAIVLGKHPVPLRISNPRLTLAEAHEQRYGGDWQAIAVRQIGQWCAYAFGGRTAHAPQDLYTEWCADARTDRTMACEGLRGWQSFVGQLPARSIDAIALLLDQHAIAAHEHEAYLYRALGSIYGWASRLRGEAFARGDTDLRAMVDLLAIRVCFDAAIARLAPRDGHPDPRSGTEVVEDEQLRITLQDALERGYTRRLLAALNPPPAQTPVRPNAQAVFCIDVRSEPLRRQLEAQDPGILTHGFAGFFGVSLDWQTEAGSSARCPVLLQPGVRLRAQEEADHSARYQIGAVQRAPAAAFTFVELLGLAYGVGLAADALVRGGAEPSAEYHAPFTLEPDSSGRGIALPTRIEMAAGILAGMSMRNQPLARLLLLCGHASTSANNPHAAGLDCGACGGHGGAINARVAAALLNDTGVRDGLLASGIALPADTWVVAGVHDTTRDTITLLDTADVPASHQTELTQLDAWLTAAGAATRAERAPTLGKPTRPANRLARAFGQRSRDWSEVRPEWALARNAAFIAARRSRTVGVDLGGRAFLHDYDWRQDHDNSVLSLIMNAPMVVASWINLQYFASTVDQHMFGAGTKALHNRVGGHGVVLGNGGDLRSGLAWQSVAAEDGSWYHEPLRLQVIIEAPQQRIDAVLAASPGVADLVFNGWIVLFALEPAGTGVVQRIHAGWVAA